MINFIFATIVALFQLNSAQMNALHQPILFFSTDNGATWKNGSAGLPDSVQIGLGAIAVSKNTMAVSLKRYGIYLFNTTTPKWVSIPTDARIINANPAALAFYNNAIYAGTQYAGVFASRDKKTWIPLNKGLTNLTIRRFAEINNRLYACTNNGLYAFDELHQQWRLEYGDSAMQVNGAAFYNNSIYIATNKGVFCSRNGKWSLVLRNKSLHNISADGSTIYAMTYNELFTSQDGGFTWISSQKGLPPTLYTFNVIASGGEVFAGQWDGLYRKDGNEWKRYGTGLPANFALTNMKVYDGGMVVGGSASSNVK